MKKPTVFACLIVSVAAFAQKDHNLYSSKSFRILKDKVVQGPYTASVLSSTAIRSDYQSSQNERYSNLLEFKFSLNEKDNELPIGTNHQLLLNGEQESPLYVFGQPDAAKITQAAGKLSVDFDFTFRLDMNPVLKQFAERGYYEAFDGSRIAKNDFKGVYIAGASLPLSWDFVNLEEKGLKLTDVNNDGIYEIKLRLNPALEKVVRTWNLTRDISAKAQYKSPQPLVDALYNMSLEEAQIAIEPDSTFRTGTQWAGVWTRDISYSILLAFAYLEPEVAKISLMKKVKRDRVIQDTGSGGSWPVSSDRMVWAIAAWEVYKVTGDRNWLEQVYPIIKNSVEDDYKVIHNAQTGMFSGESSFLDWREQTYPKWMSNKDIYQSQNLGTNAVHYRVHVILAEMAKLLGQPSEVYTQRAEAIKKGINEQLWLADKGYYAQYLYGRNFQTVSPRFEALGEALTVLFGIADAKRSAEIVSKSPLTEFGTTCIYPQIPGIPPYHNNAIWPFVQSYWNLAAAQAGNSRVLEHGLAAVYRAAGLFLTNYENMVADTGDYKGTEINSDHMLWSMAGNLAMVYRLFTGLQFEADQLVFAPVIPKSYGGERLLSNFKYRQTTLDISVSGYGNRIASFEIDGKKMTQPHISAAMTGHHKIKITMANNDFGGGANKVPNEFTATNPQTSLSGNELNWKAVDGAVKYLIYRNGKRHAEVQAQAAEQAYIVSETGYAEYAVSAIAANGTESFLSEPLVVSKTPAITVEAETVAAGWNDPYVNFSGSGFIGLTKTENRRVTFKVSLPDDGDYAVDFRYSNGSGPWNTDNKCAIRSLYVDNHCEGAMVFPQRGTGEWSDWGWSNSRKVHLVKGDNNLTLQFDEWNENMNVEVNTAMLDLLRLYKL